MQFIFGDDWNEACKFGNDVIFLEWRPLIFVFVFIAWSVFWGYFSEDSTSAHCSNSRFSRLFPLFLLDLFLSTKSLLRRSPQNRMPLGRNPQLYWKASLSRRYCSFRSILCWRHYFIYRLYPQTNFTREHLPAIIIELIILGEIPDAELQHSKWKKVGPTLHCQLQKTRRNSFTKLKYHKYAVHINAWIWNWPFKNIFGIKMMRKQVLEF